MITDAKQRLFCTGFSSTAGHVILTQSSKTFVVDSRYFFAAKRRLSRKGIEVISGADFSHLRGVLEREGATSLGIDFSLTTVSEYERLKTLGVELIDIHGEMEKAMAVKTEDELKSIERACKIAQKAFIDALGAVKVGMTERELAAELEYCFKKYGASDKSFDTIVGFGANSAVPHHETGEARLKYNSPVLMDFGCIYNGYCSDMTRTFWFGDKPTEEFKKAYKSVLRSHLAAYVQAEAGMTGAQIDKIARNILTEDGYGSRFTHSLGHGIGVNIHEYPWVSPKKENTVEDGMVFSIEPGVYLNGRFGIRIEDTVVMQGGRPHSYMKVTKDLCLLKGGKLKKYKKI